jgi:hypothetical protein
MMWLWRNGVSFKRVACLGRQGIHVSVDRIAANLRQFGLDPALAPSLAVDYAEPLFRALGAEDVCSFDASDYEGAIHVHDFNRPISGEFAECFDVVLDGGSLEHIFNVPVAIANCMSMVKVGGCYVGITPANNLLGHGFYQFSPEFYFRVFSIENGFVIKHVIAYEDFPGAPWFRVTDPASVNARVTLVNSKPTYLLIVASKIASRSVYFAATPQQSDYAAAWEIGTWNPGSTVRPPGPPRWRGIVHKILPGSVRKIVSSLRSERAMQNALRLSERFEEFDPQSGLSAKGPNLP